MLQEELGRAGAYNPIGGMGVMMFGPTLLEYGTEEQKKKLHPRHRDGERPLVSGLFGAQRRLRPRQHPDLCRRCKGDHYEVNGQKTWTFGRPVGGQMLLSGAGPTRAQKHAGISFLLIEDMHADGVEVRPIKLISGQSPFCETFFTNVKVPKENLVGREGQGWEIGTRLLQHERNSLSGGGGSMGRMMAGPTVADLAKQYRGTDDKGRVDDRRSAHPHNQARHGHPRLSPLTLRRARRWRRSPNQGPSAATSIMKNVGARITQDKAELSIEIMGMNGLGWEGEGFSVGRAGADADMAVGQGGIDLWRLDRDPEQHRRQAHPGDAGSSVGR